MRINRGQELVIGGYTLGGKSFDALVLGYYQREASLRLAYRNGFTPALREELLKAMRPLKVKDCPLPISRRAGLGVGARALPQKR